jgi:SMI1 / KNR4 family (SUKH-1)
MRGYVEHLVSRGVQGEPGLDDVALSAFEKRLGARLPDQVRELYQLCAGYDHKANKHVPLRLMPPGEALDVAANLRDEDVAMSLRPAPEARYLFADDSGNFAGVYVTGPLTGAVVILDHDDPERAPRFRDPSGFLDRVVQTGREGGYHEDLRTDFPLGPDCPPDLVAWSQPLAALYLDRFRAGAAIPAEDDRIFDVFSDLRTALYLLPPTEWTVLREMLGSPHQYVRFTALTVAAVHRPTALVPEVFAYARSMRADGNYTHWAAAFKALDAMGARAEVDALRQDLPEHWTLPPVTVER